VFFPVLPPALARAAVFSLSGARKESAANLKGWTQAGLGVTRLPAANHSERRAVAAANLGRPPICLRLLSLLPLQSGLYSSVVGYCQSK
jgi:hypothetical protein